MEYRMANKLQTAAVEISQVMQNRKELLEMYCAAFLQQVGSKEATKYQLVERHSSAKITWRFELIEQAQDGGE